MDEVCEGNLAGIDIVLGRDRVEVSDLRAKPSQQAHSILMGDGGDWAPSFTDLQDAVHIGGGSDEFRSRVNGGEVWVFEIFERVVETIRDMRSFECEGANLEPVDCWGVGGFESTESSVEVSWVI